MKPLLFFSLTLLLAAPLVGCSDNNTNLALGTLERDRIVLKATAAEIGTWAARLAIRQPPSDAGRRAQLTK